MVESGADSEDDDYVETMEFTREDHMQIVRTPSSSSSRHGVGRRLGGLLPRRPKKISGGNTDERQGRSGASVSSDNATNFSVDAVQSVANFSVVSHDTVKMSNRKEAEAKDGPSKKKGKTWNKLVRIVSGKKPPPEASSSTPPSPPHSLQRQHSHSEDRTPLRKSLPGGRIRFNTSDSKNLERSRSSPGVREQERLDQTIRGRLDGVDVLSLGGAQSLLMPVHSDDRDNPSQPKWGVFPDFSFTGERFNRRPKEMILDMLWQSSGKPQPEIVLEGFIPGGDDRWTVRLEKNCQLKDPRKGRASPAPPPLQRVGSDERETSDDGSVQASTQKLWESIWGNDPVPANTNDLDRVDAEEDPLLHLAAENSIPIDLDEDTFIISTREHVNAIHEIAAIPLSNCRFESALAVFQKLLKGIGLTDDPDLKFMKGAAIHNIGMIQLWQGHFPDALRSFNKAIEERSHYLPRNHPDTAVSLMRKSMVLVALERFEEAAETLVGILPSMPADHIVRAKFLNNLGVIHYLQQDFYTALKRFTKSLEIQRLCLDGPVRREATVFGAAITLGNMGKLYLQRSDFELAYFVYEEALLLQTTIFRKDHDIVVSSLTDLALAKAMDNQTEKSLQILKSCLRSQKTRYGMNYSKTIETLGLLGYLHAGLKEYEDALKCMVQVRKFQRAHLDKGHPSLRKTKDIIVRTEAAMGKEDSLWV